MTSEVEQPSFTLKLNERGEVVLVSGEESRNLGPREVVSRELERFLAELRDGAGEPEGWRSPERRKEDAGGAHIEIDEANFRLDPDLSSGL